MFIQMIQGRVADEEGLRSAMSRWREQCEPGAVGWLGTTAGFTDDGRFVAVARFESDDAARQNSDRPEQGQWWAATSKCFDGDVTFFDASDVTTWLDGGSDDAGFVQIIQGRMHDPEGMRALMERHSDDIRQARPEIIGATVGVAPDGNYVQTVYFTSESEARANESVPPPPDVAEAMAAEMQDAKFVDLRHPTMMSPR